MTCQRYSDADIVDAGPTVALRSGTFSARVDRALAALCAAILIAGSGLVVYRRLCGRRLAEPPGPSYQRPDPLTPFTLLTLLRRIRQDQAVELGDADRRRLDESISGMERQFFERPAGPAAQGPGCHRRSLAERRPRSPKTKAPLAISTCPTRPRVIEKLATVQPSGRSRNGVTRQRLEDSLWVPATGTIINRNDILCYPCG